MTEYSLESLQEMFPEWEVKYIDDYDNSFYRFVGDKCDFFIAKIGFSYKILEQIKDIYKSFNYIIQFLLANNFMVIENDETLFLPCTYYCNNNIKVSICDGIYYIEFKDEIKKYACNSDEFISKMKEILDTELQNKPVVYNK